MENMNIYKAALKKRLAVLDVRMHSIDSELDQPKDHDLGKQVVEIETEEVLEGLGHAAQNEVIAIRQALDRISKSTYGECLECGSKISDERLSVLPATPLCKVCAAKNA